MDTANVVAALKEQRNRIDQANVALRDARQELCQPPIVQAAT